MALEEQVRGKRARYTGYRSFQYLEAGVDYAEFKLAKEVDRVPSRRVDVSAEQEKRVQKLLEACLVVSLHDHAFVVPEDPQQIFEYRRAGRDWTGYEGLAVSGIDAIFDCLMDGTACITSKAGWKWDDIIWDLGMRLSDIAHQEMVIRAETSRDILRAEQNDGGLTEFGRAAVLRMNKLGIAIDISHSGDQTSLDTIEASQKPIFITHAGARGLWNTKRMKPDEVLQRCAAKGGVIGIEAAPHTTLTLEHPRHSIESFMQHFEYCVDLIGIDHVAFGPDTLFGDHVALHHAFARQLSIKSAHGQQPFD